MKYIRIVGDTNDADYVSNFLPITDEQIVKYTPIFEAIKAFPGRHNWNDSDEWREGTLGEDYAQFTNGELEEDEFGDSLLGWFREEIMDGIYGTHSIKSIEIIEVESITRII